MPTYTYRCNNCDYEFDIKQRMADDPLTDCPDCETDNSLRKVLNSVGIVFKGSGFYVTDSRGKKSAATPSTNGKSSENGSSAKTDSESSAPKESGDSKASATDTSKKTSEKTAV
ncbi:MAG: zinc ribbon domain-containing protein [Anaerolineales bacterium]|nr:zinc ribbon domain-containing protein [Anaerolineales bacterium]MCB8936886.1 FmdB family transcriptional regulator [Ardenticatenaceae bacterium]